MDHVGWVDHAVVGGSYRGRVGHARGGVGCGGLCRGGVYHTGMESVCEKFHTE